MPSPVPIDPSATRLCPLCPQEPWWVPAYCPPWESTGVLGWSDMAAACLLVPFCPVARAQLVLLPHNIPSLVPGSCRSTGELSLPGDHPAWLFLPLLLKALPRPSVTQGSHRLRIRHSCPPWRLWSVHHHAEASVLLGPGLAIAPHPSSELCSAFRKVPIAEVAFEEVPGRAETPWQTSTAPTGPQAGLPPPSAEPRDRVLVISSP